MRALAMVMARAQGHAPGIFRRRAGAFRTGATAAIRVSAWSVPFSRVYLRAPPRLQ
jgi:hypothetical protein